MKLKKEKILVIGAGAWGTSIANLIAKNSYEVFLTANIPAVLAEINKTHTNKDYLPGIKLSPNLNAIPGLKADVDFVFIVVPSVHITPVFQQISKTKFKKNCSFVICSKGVEQKSLMLLSDSFEKITKIKDYAALSGPNFALEVANDAPSVTNIASHDKKLAQKVIKILNNNHFHAIYSSDPRTAEICGIVKNIIAIGCGMVDGLELGVNAKSALVMKGISEIQLLCKKMKASTDITNAAGFGDIFLTCSSSKSRNNSLGTLVAQGKGPKDGVTYEGAASAKAISALTKKLKLKLDLCEAINEILTRKFSSKQIEEKIIKAILK